MEEVALHGRLLLLLYLIHTTTIGTIIIPTTILPIKLLYFHLRLLPLLAKVHFHLRLALLQLQKGCLHHGEVLRLSLLSVDLPRILENMLFLHLLLPLL